MEKITIKQQPISIQDKEKLVRNLMCAVLLQAVRDYVGDISETDRKTLPDYYFNKTTIINDLRKPRMKTLTNGLSETVASQLKHDAKQIKENLSTMVEDFEIKKVATYENPIFDY